MIGKFGKCCLATGLQLPLPRNHCPLGTAAAGNLLMDKEHDNHLHDIRRASYVLGSPCIKSS